MGFVYLLMEFDALAVLNASEQLLLYDLNTVNKKDAKQFLNLPFFIF
jgi:hypothetical protein